jgi:hypothetical protein
MDIYILTYKSCAVVFTVTFLFEFPSPLIGQAAQVGRQEVEEGQGMIL